MAHELWNKKFVHVLCIEGALQMGYYLQNPLVSNYAVFLGATVAMAGFLSGLNAFTALLMRPVTGFASDKLGKKRLLVMAAVLYVVCSFGCSLATSVGAVGFFRALFGIAFAFKSVVAVALVSLVVSPDVMGRAVGWYGAAHTVTNALGPVVGAAIAAHVGYSAAFAAAGFMQLAGLGLALTFHEPVSREEADASATAVENELEPKAVTSPVLEEDPFAICPSAAVASSVVASSPDPSPPVSLAASDTSSCQRLRSFGMVWVLHALKRLFYFPALSFSVVAGMSTIAFGSVGSLMLLVGDMRGIAGASLYFTVFAVVTVLSKPVAGRVSDGLGVRAVVIPMELVGAFGMVVLAFSYSLAPILLGGACMGLGHGAAFSALQAEAVRGVPKERVGSAANTFFIGSDVGMWAGPFASACILQMLGAEAMFLFNAACFIVALLLFLATRRK